MRRRSPARLPARCARGAERLGVDCVVFGGLVRDGVRGARALRRRRRAPARDLERARRGARPSARRARELFDLALHRFELRGAEAVELLAALPEPRQLLDARVAALEPLDDRLELALASSKVELSQRSLRRCRRRRARRSRRLLELRRRADELVASVHDRVAALERRERARAVSRACVVSSRAVPALEREERRAGEPLVRLRRAGRRGAPRHARRRACSARRVRARRSRSSARSGTTRRAAAVGVEARTSAARSQSGVSCSCPTAETTGTGRRRPRARRARRRTAAGPRSCRRRGRARSRRRRGGRGRRSQSRSTPAARGPARRSRRRGRSPAGSAARCAVSTSRFAAASLPVTSPISRGNRGSGRFRSAAKSPSAASFRFSRSSAARWAPRPIALDRQRAQAEVAALLVELGAAEDVDALAVLRARGRARRTARAASARRGTRRSRGP